MTSIHTTNSRGSIQNDTGPQTEDSRFLSAMLFPLAFVQARLFWVYSVIWTLYTRLSSEDISQPTSSKSSQQTSSEPQSAVENALTASEKASRRSRGQSAPPPSSQEPSSSSSSPIQQEQRTRGKTISTESPSTSLSTRRAFHLNNNELVLLRPLPQDERTGTTCPPQWWQKTRFYLDARKQQQRSSSPSPAPSPAFMSDPALTLSRFSESSVDKPTKKESAAAAVVTTTNQGQEAHAAAATPLDSASFEKRTQSKRKRFLDLLNHHHNHHHFSGKHHFWKKKTGPAPAL